VSITCPALLISAPASGQGKTLVTAALARRHRSLGRDVRVFKTGPDFIDPMILEQASGNPVYQLDLFMGGEAHCKELLLAAALEADLILIEGAMGLFDGDPSSADLAIRFGIPVLGVIQASAMAQTFGAIAHGLSTWRQELNFIGALANLVGSQRHAEMLENSLKEKTNVTWFGSLARDPFHSLPERHLGLIQAAELIDLDARIQHAADALSAEAEQLPPSASFSWNEESISPSKEKEKTLYGVRIAVAKDVAFSFIYPANLDALYRLGAEVHFFSPLEDSELPECDAIWLPGGYPELHLQKLADNLLLRDAIRAHHATGKPILAECGGLLYLSETLTNSAGESATMLGIIPASATMGTKLSALGLQEIAIPEGRLRGHTFHYSQLKTTLVPIAQATNPNGGVGEFFYRLKQTSASYVHLYFPSNPNAIAQLFLTAA